MSTMHLSDAERQQFRVEPTPEVIQAAEATILAHERAIASVEERVAHLLNQVQDLRYEQARHRAAIARCRGLVTLARRLPAGVVQQAGGAQPARHRFVPFGQSAADSATEHRAVL